MKHNFKPNKLETIDGVLSGILVINKPKDLTSHDIVNKVRWTLKTKRVGHAGTLDPFASGVLVVLVGKATKLSDSLTGQDKRYKAEFILGIETNSLDPEGEIISIKSVDDIKKEHAEDAVSALGNISSQYVPVFSSTRFEGEKLRVLARKYHHFKIETINQHKEVLFFDEANTIKKQIPLPTKEVSIWDTQYESFTYKSLTEYKKEQDRKFPFTLINSDKEIGITAESFKKEFLETRVLSVTASLSCSKGTFVRSIAPHLAENIYGTDFPGMVIELERESSGKYSLDESFTLEEFIENYG